MNIELSKRELEILKAVMLWVGREHIPWIPKETREEVDKAREEVRVLKDKLNKIVYKLDQDGEQE